MIKIEKESRTDYIELTLSSEVPKDQLDRVKDEINHKMSNLKNEGYTIHQNIFWELTNTDADIYTTFAILRKYNKV